MKPEALAESVYNLACAHAMLGELETACAEIAEYFASATGNERGERIKEARKDPQLGSLDKAPCFKQLLKDLKEKR
jgi:hypothetical protein